MKAIFYNPDLIDLGYNIKHIRELRNYTQQYLANEIEITRVALSNIEMGKVNITINRLFAIAKALKVSIELLFKDPQTLLS